jgi:hypothetical protein
VYGEHCAACKVLAETLAQERVELMLGAKPAPPAVLAAHAAIVGDAAAAAVEPEDAAADAIESEDAALFDLAELLAEAAEPPAVEPPAVEAFPLPDWTCGVDGCRRPKPCHVHIGGPNPVEADAAPDWMMPAEWFVDKHCITGASFEVDERDGKVYRVRVDYLDLNWDTTGDVWVTPEQLERWSSAECMYVGWLREWKLRPPAPEDEVDDEAGKVPLLAMANGEALDAEDDGHGGFP